MNARANRPQTERAKREIQDRQGRLGARDWIAVAVVLAVALALRLLYLSQIRDHALFSVLTADPAIYHAQALGILEGRLAPEHAYFHSSPLYPFFLAAIMKLAGESLHVVRIAQALVGCASVLLIHRLALVTVGRRPALIAAALAALYVPFIFFEGEFLEITLVIAFLAGALILLQKVGAEARGGTGPSFWMTAAGGALLGLAALGKPNLLLVAPVGAAWLLFRWHERGRWFARGPRYWTTAVLFVVATGLAILPATIHNFRTEGDLIPVSSNGGINLFIGNHPGAPGTFTVPPEMRFDLRVASKTAAERELKRELTSGEASDFWAKRALEFIRARPAMWLDQTARKFTLFWNHYEIPNHYDLNFVKDAAPVLRIPLGTFAVVAPLGLAGLVLASIRRRNVGLLVAFGIAFMCSVVPFFITGRYRLAIVLALLPGAGYALNELVEFVRGRAWRQAAWLSVSVAALAVLVNVDVIEFSTSQMHNTLGAILARRGDLSGAAAEFSAALDDNPADLSARRNLGLAYLELGRPEDAARELETAVSAHPGYFEARLELGRAYAQQDSTRRAVAAWTSLLALDPPPHVASQAVELLSRYSQEER
jgi:4-amino-4-deoxy-L-arabinose transferase-like glycosyltransferase